MQKNSFSAFYYFQLYRYAKFKSLWGSSIAGLNSKH